MTPDILPTYTYIKGMHHVVVGCVQYFLLGCLSHVRKERIVVVVV